MDEQNIQVRTEWQVAPGLTPTPVNQIAVTLAAPVGQEGKIEGLILFLGYVTPPLVDPSSMTPEDLSAFPSTAPIVPSAAALLTPERARELRDNLTQALSRVGELNG
ncbi:hypothetical protein [Curtobacterium flaccumfaciens]|jgi:hypothetical protein|uniref:hypothetical protein n=1 Tax=Curtobacterium flaccumfaciens TaxID=2035 RepID=UPI002175AA90|nr:hypothetical protein [Curtobacterium flaccumfaciens]MCS5493127.1 hypothetical protein [Curtobacterium flaccumfaciens pv. flaccumfaciens]